jgi:hypothetical protein
MNIKKLMLPLVLTLAISGCATMKVDPGGHLEGYVKFSSLAKKESSLVVIDYECDSACLILLSSGSGLRVSKNAKFGVHEVRFVVPEKSYLDPTSKRCNSCTEYEKTLIPKCAVKLFDSRNGWDSPNLTYFTGAEVLEACPGVIQEYAEK